MTPKPLFLGNWKMHMRPQEIAAFAERFRSQYRPDTDADCGFAAPFTSLSALRELFPKNSGILKGAQNVHWLDQGAHTGEVSVPMLLDHELDFVIVGHSERRLLYGETSQNVALRARAALSAGMTAVVCIGETQEEFERGVTQEIVRAQLANSLEGITSSLERLVVAYEPVWAIGTGLAATPQIAGEVHDFLRSELKQLFGARGEQIPLLYGGSTKPDNIGELLSLANVNGALVGGSSLDADTFWQLILNGREGNTAKRK